MGRIRGAGSNTYLEYNEEGEPLEWIMEYANFDDSYGRFSAISRQKVFFMVRSFFFQIDAKIVYPIFPAPSLFVNRTVDVMFV